MDVPELTKKPTSHEAQKGEIADENAHEHESHPSNPAPIVTTRTHFDNCVGDDVLQRTGIIGNPKRVKPDAEAEKGQRYASSRDTAASHVLKFHTAHTTVLVTDRLTID